MNMILTDYRFLLDVHETNSQISLSFKQGDTGRVLYITLTENGDIFNIPQNCVAVFTALKPDGTIIFNDCEINGNEIVYTHTAQTAAVTGKVDCELRLYGAGNTLITSPHFTIFVHPTVYFDQIESKDEVNTLTNLISEANTKLANGEFIPKISIGSVSTLPAGSAASVEVSGTAEAPVLNFGIPQGEQGQAESLIPDTALSTESVKPVQNRVIALAVNELIEALEEHWDSKENPHEVTKTQVGLSEVDNTSDEDKPISKAQQEALDDKVGKEDGKGLSSNDFTDELKEKLDGIEPGANKTEAPKDGDISTDLLADKAVSFAKLGDDAKSIAFTNITVPDWAWDESDDSSLYPLRAAIALPDSGVDANYFVDIVFDDESLAMGILGQKASSYDGGFYIYAMAYPEKLVKILTADFTHVEPTTVASEVFGTINVTYAAGKALSCSDGTKTLLAKTASGSWQFGVPNAGAWLVSDGENHEVVEITEQGQSVSVVLSEPDTTLWLYKDGVDKTDVTGGWTSYGKKYDAGTTAVAPTLTFGENSMEIFLSAVSNQWRSGFSKTNNRIDLTNLKTIEINIENAPPNYSQSASTNLGLCVFGDDATYLDEMKVAELGLYNTSTVYALDVSNVSGAYYIGFICYTGSGYANIDADVVSIGIK